jgi:hypothetical protein
MERMRYHFILFSAVCTNVLVMAQATHDTSFYPLQVGNLWQYRFSPLTPVYTMSVIADTVMPNGKKYYAVKRDFDFSPSFYPEIRYERIDSNGTTWFYDSTSTIDLTMEEFSLAVGIPWTSYRKSDIGDPAQVTWRGKLLTELSGDSLVVSRVKYTFRYGEDTAIRFAQGIGIIWEEFELTGPMVLIGANVNTRVYGTLVGVNERFEDRIPLSFSLSQNFPNPFNPETFIKYELRTSARVKLTVFDIEGRCVKKLVDDLLPPGVYEVQWDGRNMDGKKSASGTYMYQIIANDHQLSKKLQLLK